MPVAFAVFTSDPNLLACELSRLSGQVALVNGDRVSALGVGHYASDELLLQQYRSEGPPREVWTLLPQTQSEAMVYHARPLRPGTSVEENAQPFRFRRWLFCHVGAINHWAAVRSRLLAELPEHLPRHLAGDSDSEAAFVLFLKHLKDAGRLEEGPVDAIAAARVLGRTVASIQEMASAAGAARTSRLDFIATNQMMLLASRSGDAPLSYRLLEGIDRCARCGISPSSPEIDPKVRAHRRVRTVAVATNVTAPQGWLEIPKGSVLAADRNLGIHSVRI